MFEPQNQPTPPQPLEDIFDQTKQPSGSSAPTGAPPRAPTAPSQASTMRSMPPVPSPSPSPTGLETRDGIRPKPFIMGGVILLILATIVFAVWSFFFRGPEAPTTDLDREETPQTTTTSRDDDADVVAPASVTTRAPEPEPEEPVIPLDADGDGLTDEEEITLGTNPRTADTDGDQLFDKEERDVYGTDPLNPDTDSDGYIDGAEVRNGYNPNGPGRLFGVPTQEPE